MSVLYSILKDNQDNRNPGMFGKVAIVNQQQSLTSAYMQPILKSDCPPIYLHTPDSVSPHQGWSC